MTETNALAEAENPTATVESPSAAEVTQGEDGQAESSTAPDAAGTAADDQEAGKGTARDRIQEQQRQIQALREYGEYWRNQAVKTPEKPSQPAGAPKRAEYPDEDSWAAAVIEHAKTEAANTARSAATQADEQRRQQEAQASFAAREAEASKRLPGYYEITRGPVPITQAMAEVIASSEKGPDLAYHLGKNPDKAVRIASMSPLQQAAALARLESDLSRPAPKPKVTAAPPPPSPVGANTATDVDMSKLSIDDWMKARSAQLRNKRS